MNATIALLLILPAQSSDDIFSDWMDIVDPKPAVVVEDETPVTPVTPVTPITPIYSNPQQQLLNITLAYNNRLNPHTYLMNSAQAVADYHASTGRWGHSNRSARPGASENIAWNSQQSITKIGNQWKSSRGHNSNWLGNWNYTGVGVAYSSGRIYAVQHFANNPAPHSSISLQSRTYQNTSRRGWFRRRR